jgi:RNA 2',3'-cyclic 3'-phosphodiesterase
MRLFIALDIDDAIRQRVSTFLDGVRDFAPEARWVRAESLHVTLKFIGEKPAETAEAIKQSLSTIRAESVPIVFQGFGFFPTAKAPRVFWIGIHAESQLARLAAAVDEAMAALGIPKETHSFSPHITLARRAGGSGAPRWRKGDRPNRSFQRLQEKLAAMPALEFGTMTAREFFLYQSRLSREGSHYTKLERFALEAGNSSPESQDSP